MGPLSGVVIWKILYWFGDEDLVIWTATSASVARDIPCPSWPSAIQAVVGELSPRVGNIIYIIVLQFRWVITISGQILGLGPANERCRYKVTASFIGWAQA